jgi:hypothetical protein
MLPGERLFYFAGFSEAPPGAELAGTWSFTNGQAHSFGVLNQLAAITMPVTGTRETALTHATIDELLGTGVSRPVGVVHQFFGPSFDGMICVFGVNPSDTEVYAYADNASDLALDTRTTSAHAGSESSFASSRVGTSYTCDVSNIPVPLSATNSLALPVNRVGIFERSASASYDWMMIVTSP